MKKAILIYSICVCLFLTGCGSTEKYEKLMKEYSTTYFNKHMKGIDGQQSAEITVTMLAKANESGVGNYDLTKLSKCKNSTKVILEIDENNNIKNYVYELKCG